MYKTRLRKVRGSVMLALPASFLEELELQDDSTVGLMIEHGRLVVDPRPRARYTLAKLLSLSDYRQQQPAEEREWIDAPNVGSELM